MAPATVWQDSTALCDATADPAIVQQDSTTLFFMEIADDLDTLFEARREAFEVIDGQPTYTNQTALLRSLRISSIPSNSTRNEGNTTSSASSWTSPTILRNLDHRYPVQHVQQSTTNRLMMAELV